MDNEMKEMVEATEKMANEMGIEEVKTVAMPPAEKAAGSGKFGAFILGGILTLTCYQVARYFGRKVWTKMQEAKNEREEFVEESTEE